MVETPITDTKTAAKPISKRAHKTQSERCRASVEKRKATLDANRVDDCTGTVTAPDDPVAQAKLKQRQAKLAESKPSARVKRSAVDRLNDPPPARGVVLIERVVDAIERELTQIEHIVSGQHGKRGRRIETERRARTLASLARTLAEVKRLRAEQEPRRPHDDDAIARLSMYGHPTLGVLLCYTKWDGRRGVSATQFSLRSRADRKRALRASTPLPAGARSTG